MMSDAGPDFPRLFSVSHSSHVHRRVSRAPFPLSASPSTLLLDPTPPNGVRFDWPRILPRIRNARWLLFPDKGFGPLSASASVSLFLSKRFPS